MGMYEVDLIDTADIGLVHGISHHIYDVHNLKAFHIFLYIATQDLRSHMSFVDDGIYKAAHLSYCTVNNHPRGKDRDIYVDYS